MSRGLTILRGKPIAALTVSQGTGAQYLTTFDPKEVWRAANTGQVDINLDLGAPVAIDTIFAGHANAGDTATWQIDRTTSIAGANPVPVVAATAFRIPDASGARQHGLVRLADPVTTRYLRLRLVQPAGAPLEIGTLLVGSRIEHPYEFKGGRRPIDLGDRIDLASGGFGFGEGAIKSSFRFTFADLDDSELNTLWRTVMALGSRRPALFVEGGDDAVLFDQVHYGVFEKFEAFERNDPADTRWALSMQDWV